MHTTIRSGLLAAIFLCLFCASAVAQQRAQNTPQSEAVLNANSSSFIATPSGGEFLEDGSFEAGSPNPFWNEFSFTFGTPLCDASCGFGGGTGPRTGAWWAWFGGAGGFFGPEDGSVSQAVTFPLGFATLAFWFEAPACADGASSFFEVNVDGNQEFYIDGTSPLCGVVGYTEQVVNLTAYADAGVHTVEFRGFELGVAGTTNWFIDDVSLTDEDRPPEARFLVTKDFNDNNEAEVNVTITCNTGLPLTQDWDISEEEHVNFVVGDFEPGTLDCVIEEEEVDGYTASYNDGSVSADNCSWEALEGGQYACRITNSLDQVEIEVTKVWIDENPQFNATNIAEAEWDCSNVALGGNDDGSLGFIGTPDSDTRSFFVYPDWEDGTDCDITEVSVPDSGIEIDDSDCQGLTVFPGLGASCTIINTRLYEGIPTLSQYGLAVLALLMLGVGFIGFRRFI